MIVYGSLPCLITRLYSYAKQKDSLQKAAGKFLLSIPGSPTLATMTPRDICRFLVFKDKDGKTQVHRNGCNHLGKKGTFECGCPLRLSYKTVDSYIGKLRVSFTRSVEMKNGINALVWAIQPQTSL